MRLCHHNQDSMIHSSAILTVLLLTGFVSAQISSTDNSITWTCPDRQVIDTAYFGYCKSGLRTS